MKFTKTNEWNHKTETATILDMNDGTFAISWPFGYEDDEYAFKTIKGAQRRLERYGFQAAF